MRLPVHLPRDPCREGKQKPDIEGTSYCRIGWGHIDANGMGRRW